MPVAEQRVRAAGVDAARPRPCGHRVSVAAKAIVKDPVRGAVRDGNHVGRHYHAGRRQFAPKVKRATAGDVKSESPVRTVDDGAVTPGGTRIVISVTEIGRVVQQWLVLLV